MAEYQSTKRGKPLKKSNWNGYGFHWTGRDDRGISVWEGQASALKFGYWFLGILGTALVSIGALVGALGGAVEGAIPLALGGSVHLGLAWYMRRHLSWLNAMGTTQDLAERLGVDRDELNRYAEEQRILPRVIVNREPLYDPADFGDAGLLLRASAAPSEDLLRAASLATATGDHLLTPAERPGEPREGEPLTLKGQEY